jgi:hypothetical protein
MDSKVSFEDIQQEKAETNLKILITLLLYICCFVIPFTVVDLYFSYKDIKCLDIDYPPESSMNLKILLRINGYMYIFFMFYAVLIFCRLVDIFNNSIIMKISIIIKLIYNLTWSILSTIVFSKMFYICENELKTYITIRLLFLYIFILFSIKQIKNLLFTKTS